MTTILKASEPQISSDDRSAFDNHHVSRNDGPERPRDTVDESSISPTTERAVPLVERDIILAVQESPQFTEEERKRRIQNRRIRMCVALFLLAFITFVIVDASTNKYIRNGMEDFLEWVEEHPGSGVVAFTAVVFCTTMLFIPGIILTLGSGYVFANAFGLGLGVLLGTLVMFVGAGAGALISFLLGRFLLRDCVTGLTSRFRLFEALDKAMEENGLRIMLLLRFSPVIYASPYLNYGAGGMAVSLRDYTISLIALLPASVMLVFLGASAGSLTGDSEEDSRSTKIIVAVGVVFTVIAVGLATYYTRQELRKISEQVQEEEEPEIAEEAPES